MSSSQPHQYRAVGVSLAVGSGLLIGCSFVLKKKGLIHSQAHAGEGVAYLKSPLWWSGMLMMICGELCNFGAYAFVEAILVTPLGALSVVICAIMSHFFLKEKLSLFGWIGCTQCILGAIIIALNGPQEQSVTTIVAFQALFLAPWFLAYMGASILAALVIIFFVAPKHGKKSMLWYILVCSLIGGISVSCTQGLGACILTSIRGDNQFKHWFIYFLLVFVTFTLLTEIYYLNVALALFNTAMVTPTYYVLFTFCTLVASVILYEGLKASAVQILTIVLGFFVICTGIFILQMSKVDPRKLTNIDRRTTILLQAARQEVLPGDDIDGLPDSEKALEATEEPGIDAVAGRFGGVGGTIIRARRRATLVSTGRSRRNTPSSLTGTEADAAKAHELRVELRKVRQQQKNGHANANADGRFTPVFSDSSSRLDSGGEEPTISMLLSSEQLSGSPAPGMERTLSARTPSVRFSGDPKPLEDVVEGSRSSQTALSEPPAALLASSNTSLPLLNLPAPRAPSTAGDHTPPEY